MSAAEDFPDVGPDDPVFPENEGPTREYPRVVSPFGALTELSKVYELVVPPKHEIRERDILWCKALIRAHGEGVIDTKQMERVLHLFNVSRPEKTNEPRRPGRLPESPA